MRVRALLLLAVVLGAVPLVGVGPAQACSCVSAKEKQHYDWADVVFTGTLDLAIPGEDSSERFAPTPTSSPAPPPTEPSTDTALTTGPGNLENDDESDEVPDLSSGVIALLAVGGLVLVGVRRRRTR